ncbi:MAG: radical SAM protein [Eubacteriales bacterium]|nr:radical SAM protein [Eubacteriales bacterium]
MGGPKGIVFDVKEFALYDGPGIRTTVFMKGCPLRCSWCHNPEGLSKEPQMLLPKEGPPRLSGRAWDAGDLAGRLLKHRDFYQMSGGGVTFSGGEPLWQWPFVREVLDQLEGVHTAVETSGHVPDEVFDEAMKAFDLVMLDIKSVDDRTHRKFTGSGNARILSHARALCAGKTPFIIRLPLIPGVNDSLENMEAAARFLKGAKQLVRVEMLPYHQAAGAKYGMAGVLFDPGFDTNRQPRAHSEPFKRLGIPVIVF